MGYKLITAPAVEPISLAEAKAHLKSLTSDEDTMVTRWILAARRRAEHITKRRFVTQTWEWLLDGFGCFEIEMPFAPLQAVVSIKYVDPGGVEQTLSALKYLVDAKTDPGRISPVYGEVWPVTRWQMNAVIITFVCGYGAEAAVPEDIKAAMLLMIGHLDQHREDVTDFQGFALPQASADLLGPYCVTRF